MTDEPADEWRIYGCLWPLFSLFPYNFITMQWGVVRQQGAPRHHVIVALFPKFRLWQTIKCHPGRSFYGQVKVICLLLGPDQQPSLNTPVIINIVTNIVVTADILIPFFNVLILFKFGLFLRVFPTFLWNSIILWKNVDDDGLEPISNAFLLYFLFYQLSSVDHPVLVLMLLNIQSASTIIEAVVSIILMLLNNLCN